MYKIDGDTVIDEQTGLVWQRSHSPERMTWEKARDYAKSLGDGWRLPTVQELVSIVDYKRLDPAIDLDLFPRTPSLYFWSSSSYAGNPDAAWNVAFNNGHVVQDTKVNANYVRCVRTGL